MRTDLIQQRKAKGLDQAALARKINLDQTSVSRIELGKQSIKPEVARKIAADVLAGVPYSVEDLELE